ncbi:sensor histidine kinase [Mangrovihabitans endophyticus]|uniref:sensor histidine kinase n=1 Tax=Mangrovihabitans endophyticus TaxID=1751298 RepID=UPI00166C54B7|nr:ATP-binding protein [Mangrovihabitans endophyticus]
MSVTMNPYRSGFTVDTAVRLAPPGGRARPRVPARPALFALAALIPATLLTAGLSAAGLVRPMWWLVLTAVLPAVAAVAPAAYRAGRAAERTRYLRMSHDTVLQTLEAMAKASDADPAGAGAELARLRDAARREASLLRRSLAELAGDRHAGSGVTPTLAEVIAGLPDAAPPVELLADADLPRLAAASREALRDAVREALGNAVKHAAARRIVVRVTAAGVGVQVVVRDDGRGFDPRRTVPGFGTRESISARLREAGGSAEIESRPGRGTRVRLWAPSTVITTRLRRRPRR